VMLHVNLFADSLQVRMHMVYIFFKIIKSNIKCNKIETKGMVQCLLLIIYITHTFHTIPFVYV